MELLTNNIGDLVFKQTWVIQGYTKIIKKQEGFDSEPFEVNINGIFTKWNLSIRYWKGAYGDRLINPVVLCLNQMSCTRDTPWTNDSDTSESSSSSENHTRQQILLNFQFGVFNHEIGREEPTSVSHYTLTTQPLQELVSVGFQEVNIKTRHLDAKGNVTISVKMQMCSIDDDKHSLVDDMQKMMEDIQLEGPKDKNSYLPNIIVLTAQGEEFPVHRHIMACRSKVFAEIFESPIGFNGHTIQKMTVKGKVINIHKFEMDDLSKESLRELIRYAYTDRVKGLECHAQALLATAERYGLPGLKTICARSLAYTIEPENVASLLLLADRCHCDGLKRAALSYCEGHAGRIRKSLAWKVMEMVNPNLFQEACEAGLGDSNSSNLDSLNSYEA